MPNYKLSIVKLLTIVYVKMHGAIEEAMNKCPKLEKLEFFFWQCINKVIYDYSKVIMPC